MKEARIEADRLVGERDQVDPQVAMEEGEVAMEQEDVVAKEEDQVVKEVVEDEDVVSKVQQVC